METDLRQCFARLLAGNTSILLLPLLRNARDCIFRLGEPMLEANINGTANQWH